ncbi:MAG: DTW domain-containing protein [Myxococcales bacterium]|nr:DTW domain-containing protein [Myxococcales bacterium]
MRHRTESHLPGRCKRCWLIQRYCLCAELPCIRTHTRILLLRHGREAEKSTNSARIAALALEGSTLVDYAPYQPSGPRGDACAKALEEALSRMTAPVLLFPGGAESPPEPSHLIVLDGTWRQARKMLRQIPALANLPRLSLPPPAMAPPRLRRSPFAENMTTLEAIASAVARLEGAEKAAPLFELHAKLVERVLKGRGALRSADEAWRCSATRSAPGSTPPSSRR